MSRHLDLCGGADASEGFPVEVFRARGDRGLDRFAQGFVLDHVGEGRQCAQNDDFRHHATPECFGDARARDAADADRKKAPQQQGFARPPPRGLEPLSENAQVSQSQALNAIREVVLPECLPDSLQSDPDLRTVITTWPTLPASVRAGVVALVRAAAASEPPD